MVVPSSIGSGSPVNDEVSTYTQQAHRAHTEHTKHTHKAHTTAIVRKRYSTIVVRGG
jgi:hypothetical protein